VRSGHPRTRRLGQAAYAPEDRSPQHVASLNKQRVAHGGAMPDSKPTILLAEDEPALRHLFRKIFETDGYPVLVAENGAQAIQIANEHPDGIALLVSDVQMPGMSGPDLAKALKRRRPDIRVL